MASPARFRFSLRTLFIGCAVAAVITGVVVSRYRAYDRWIHSIRKSGGSGGFAGFGGTFDNVQLRYYRDHANRPVAYVMDVYDHQDPNLPARKLGFSYTQSVGGILRVNGKPIDPAIGPVLIVNGPYGYAVSLKPTEQELALLADWDKVSMPKRISFWQQRIEPRIYKLTGESDGGRRNGTWVYRLLDGTLYLEAGYDRGQRHGDWTTYYPNGKVQVRRQFEADKPSGRWEYFDEEGNLVGSLEWKNGFIVRETNLDQQVSQGDPASRRGQSRRDGIVISDEDGGRFFINGREMRRPRIDPALLVERN